MHGYLRFLLAIFVVLSHSNRPGLVDIGVAAVVVFYMLAGYVVTHLLDKHFPTDRLLNFYIERLLRILPLYWAFLVGVTLFLVVTGAGKPTFTFGNVFANITIIPLNYYMFIDIGDVGVIQGFCILPPAWSLAVELQAYAILPLILGSQNRKWLAGCTSLLIATMAAIGVLDPNIWGYRLLPGVLFIFLTGAAISRTHRNPTQADGFDRRFPILCWIWLLVILIGLNLKQNVPNFTTAIGIGFLLGMPVVQFTANQSVRLPFDSIIGRLSYGLFLIHMPISWIYEYFFKGDRNSNAGIVCVIIISTLLTAAASYSIEEWIWPLRRKITQA